MYRDSRRLRLVLVLLILTSFTLITIDYRAGEGTVLTGLRRGVSAVVGPIQRAVTSVVRPIGNALSTLGDLGGLNDEVKDLREENTRLRGQLRETEDLRRRVAEMEALLRLSTAGQYRIVAARVVGVGASEFEWTATIDVGERDGIRAGMTVVNGDGLVGRVLRTSRSTSDVLLANDPQFKVSARMAGSADIGTLSGRGERRMLLELLNADADVEVGQPVVTRGSQTFMPGVPIGVATRVTRKDLAKTVEVAPYVRYAALDLVAVVVQRPRTDPRDSVLPTPYPSPTATPTGATAPPPGGTATPTPTPTVSP